MTEIKIDGYSFFLKEGNTVIYVFKDEKYISDHFYATHKDALKIMDDLKEDRRKYEVGAYEYTISKKVRLPRKVNKANKGTSLIKLETKYIWRKKIKT